MSYGVKYTCTHKTFTNQTETTYRIDILEDGYSGSSTEILGVGEVFNLEYEKIDATKPLSTPLQNSRLEFNLLVRDASDQAILTEIFDNDERTFKMQLYQNGSLFWDGYVLNDLLEYGQGDYPQEGRIVAKDMTALKSFTYPLEDERRTVIHQIGVLLDPLNIGTGLKTVTSWSHDEMSSSNTFLAQTYLDTIAFREFRPFTDTGANDDRQITYYDALEQLARSFGLVIRQSFGEWHIVQISELRGSTSRVCTFDFAGSQATNAVQDITDSIDSETSYILPRSQNTFNPGLKEARYTFNHRTLERDIVFPESVGLEDGDSNETPKTFSQQIISESTQDNVQTGRGGITPTVRFRSNVDISYLKFLDGTTQQNDARIADVEVSRTTYAKIVIKIETVSKTYYLSSQGDWSTDFRQIFVKGFDGGRAVRSSVTGGRSGARPYISRKYKVDFDVQSDPIPTDADGELKVELYLARMDAPAGFPAETGSAQEQFYAGADVYSTTTRFKNIEFDVEKPAELANTDSLSFNILNDGSNLSAVYEHGSVIFGDGPESFSPSALRYSTQEADFTSGGWDSPGGSGTYSQTLLREILFIQASARRNLSAELYGEYKPHRVLSFESLRFFFLGGSLNGNNVWSADFLEISYESPSSSFDELTEGGGSAFSGASSGDLQTFREAVKANQFFNTIFLSNFIGELSTAIEAGSTITSFVANLSAQIRVGEDFVLVDKENERPFFVSVVADPVTEAEEYNTGENVTVHVEEQVIKTELPVGSPVILAGGLLESYFTIDPSKLLISVQSRDEISLFGKVNESFSGGETRTTFEAVNENISATNPVVLKDNQEVRLRREDGESQILTVNGNQNYTSSPFTITFDSFETDFLGFGVNIPQFAKYKCYIEPFNQGSSVASIDIKADANEASITSLTSITNANTTNIASVTQRVTTAESEIDSNTSILTTNGLSGSTNITQRTSIVEGEVDTVNSQIVLKADAQGNISAVRLDAGADGSNISITADDVNINNINFNSAGGTISSNNYSEGVSGWEINGLGEAEFSTVTIRGATSSIGESAKLVDLDVTGTLTMNTGGEVTNSGGDYVLDDDGLRMEAVSAGVQGNPNAIRFVSTTGTAVAEMRAFKEFIQVGIDFEDEHTLELKSLNADAGRDRIRLDADIVLISNDLDVSGDIECTTLTETSDRYQKENIEDIGPTLDKIVQLSGKRYDMLGPSTTKNLGLLAQDVEELFPEVVRMGSGTNQEGERIQYKTLSYTQLIPALIESIKELKQEIDQLKNG